MNIEITPSKLEGSVNAPSSKSMCHRLLVAALFGKQDTQINTNCFSKDIYATCSCVSKLGKNVSCNPDKQQINITCDNKQIDYPELFANESGTTARFILPCASTLLDGFTLDGCGRLTERPFSHLCEQMRKNGVSINSDTLPITCKGKLCSGLFTLPGNISTQFISGLLFALPTLEGDSKIQITTEIEGFGYIAMTLDVLKKFGIQIEYEDNCFNIKGNQIYKTPAIIDCEADWSNAAFFVVANEIGSNIELSGLNYNSCQGDKEILSLCRNVSDIDASNIPDLVPILSVLYSVSGKDVRIYNAGRLRLKESDRIKATCQMINALGGSATEKQDEIIIHGKHELCGGIVDSFNDHRIVMASAIASTKCKNKVIINNAQAVDKSYPTFFNDFASLGGKINVI